MAAILGRTRAIGLGKETTPGTAVAATNWYPFQDNTIEDKIDRILDNSGLGTRYTNFQGDTNRVWSEGGLNGILYPKAFGDILLAAMGNVSSAAHPTATGAFVHTFSVGNTPPSYTLSLTDDNESVRAAFAKLNTLEITFNQDGYAQFTSSWMGRQAAATGNTVAYVTEQGYRPQDCVIKVADDVAGLATATAIRMREGSLSLNNNLITEPSLGTTDPEFYTGVLETSISLSRLYLNTDFKDMVFGSTKKALSITLTRADQSIGTGTPTNPSISFVFQPGFFSEWSREGGLDDLKTENITYNPLFSVAAGKQLEVVVTNDKASY